MGAYDVHAARLFGTVTEKTGIVPFMELAERVMTLEPYASAHRVYWVVDNGSSHRGQRSVERMAAAWPNAQLVHLPVHASWLNQIEVVFSVIQRKVIKPADFADLAALADRLCRFEVRYNAMARPFDWPLAGQVRPASVPGGVLARAAASTPDPPPCRSQP